MLSGLRPVQQAASDNGTGFSVGGFLGPFAFVRSTITGLFIGGASASFASSTIENNGTGINNPSGSNVISFDDNHIKLNGTDVKGTITNVGTQ
jgi:hypothetical protein